MQFEHISEHPSTSLRNGLHSTKKDKELLHIIENIIDSQKKMLSPIQKKVFNESSTDLNSLIKAFPEKIVGKNKNLLDFSDVKNKFPKISITKANNWKKFKKFLLNCNETKFNMIEKTNKMINEAQIPELGKEFKIYNKPNRNQIKNLEYFTNDKSPTLNEKNIEKYAKNIFFPDIAKNLKRKRIHTNYKSLRIIPQSSTLMEKNEEIPFGSFEENDVPEFIIKNNLYDMVNKTSPEKRLFLVSWKSRPEGKKPKDSYCLGIQLREKSPLILLEYYEKKSVFS